MGGTLKNIDELLNKRVTISELEYILNDDETICASVFPSGKTEAYIFAELHKDVGTVGKVVEEVEDTVVP